MYCSVEGKCRHQIKAMLEPGSITRLIYDLREGRVTLAADSLWQRYYKRLVGLARKKLKGAPRRTADEEDIVLEAFRSFCAGAAEGRFPRLNDRHDLWQVLVMLTARKATDQRKHDQRKKRGGAVPFDCGQDAGREDMHLMHEIVGNEPTPLFAALITDELARLFKLLDDDILRQVAQRKLEGFTNAEIAEQMDVQSRTVERKLQLIRKIWTEAGCG